MAVTGEWLQALKPEFSKPYYKGLYEFVKREYETKTVFPPPGQIYRALEMTPLSEVKAVILGQDPYHNIGQANGLAFSVNDGVDIPPSLVNIFREIRDETGCEMPKSGNLEGWARQGVLLLNTVLTVRAHEANSHRGHGWEGITDRIIEAVEQQDRYIVFMLWGNPAQTKKPMIENPKHLVLTSSHPSPLSAYRTYDGFFGNGHFLLCNDFLERHGVEPIDWGKTC